MTFTVRYRFCFRLLLLPAFLLTCDALVMGQDRPTTQEVSIERKLIDGKKFILLGDWEKAEALFRAILQDDVQNSAANYELSRTLAATGRYNDALSCIQKSIRLDPTNEWYLLMEADIREKSGDLFATMEVYDRLIKLRSNQAHYYEMQISLCKKTGDVDRLLRTLDQYEASIGLTESITRVRFESLDKLERKAEAMAALDKLTVHHPYNTDYKFLAAAYAIKIGQQDKANKYYQDVIVLDPQNARAKLALASSEKDAGDDIGYLQSIKPVMTNPGIEIDIKVKELIPYLVSFSKNNEPALGSALADLTGHLVKTHPKEAKAFAIHGDVLSILGRRQEAIDAYIASTSLNGGVYVVWEQLLSLLMAQHAFDELIRQSESAMTSFPNQAYIFYAQGYGLFKKERYDDALDILNDALIMTGRNAGQKISIYNILGLVYDQLGDLEKSSIAFESALSIDPRHPETLAYYSLMLSGRISQSEKAVSMTQKALSQENLSPAIHEILAKSLYNQKKYTDANASIQVVLQADPYGDAYNLAGDILIKLGNTEEAVSMWQKALEAGCEDSDLKSKISDAKAQ